MNKGISIAGSGNVATHLAKAFFDAGVRIEQIFSRNLSHAEALAQKVGARAVDRPELISNDAGVLILALPDEAIEPFAAEVNAAGHFDGIVAHTSGTQPLSALRMFENSGVFYPLQSFSRFSNPLMKEVPFCLEAVNSETLQHLTSLASLISENVREVCSAQRAVLHLAAVFACNFSNHMYAISADLLKDAGIDGSILKPLIRETANRLTDIHPALLQTGPAVRGDGSTMGKHKQLLENYPVYREIYKMLSNSIVSAKEKTKK
jgi:predicted short-subunit dehydrogenase-like oxidoreductase (DUF2520 family)